MRKAPTIRSLARRLRLSVATVSEALRDSPRVTASTRARVQRAASLAGYQVNPLLGAALSAVRRARHQHYRGTLALIDFEDENPTQYMVFHRALAAGAETRAQELGFQTELFWLGAHAAALPLSRLPRILQARGITGAVLLPFNQAQDFSEFDFARLAAVQMDYCLLRPRLHTILPDHYVSLYHALERLTARGYQRLGLCLEERKDSRIKRKWSAAFHAYQQDRDETERIPPLLRPTLTREGFLEWFKATRPDAIIGHMEVMLEWLQGIGVRVPDQVGFFNLNLTECTIPCAGLNLGPERLAAAAVETVVAMVHRHERGIPVHPQTVTLEAAWEDGPTLRR